MLTEKLKEKLVQGICFKERMYRTSSVWKYCYFIPEVALKADLKQSFDMFCSNWSKNILSEDSVYIIRYKIIDRTTNEFVTYLIAEYDLESPVIVSGRDVIELNNLRTDKRISIYLLSDDNMDLKNFSPIIESPIITKNDRSKRDYSEYIADYLDKQCTYEDDAFIPNNDTFDLHEDNITL